MIVNKYKFELKLLGILGQVPQM